MRLMYFVRSKNLLFSFSDVKQICSQCRVCAEIKPQFQRLETNVLIKATQPWERISIDFKGPVKSSCNPFLLVVVDQFSRFPFVFQCRDVSAKTVIACLSQLFSICGIPGFVHSDRGSAFMSRDVKTFLHSRGVATSRTAPYHATGNSQCERYNQTIWKAVRLCLKGKGVPEEQWETVLADVLHSIRSLLCTSTNTTSHERFFSFCRISASGRSLPSWLRTPRPVLLRRCVRTSKSDPMCDEVELIEANLTYAHVKFPDG